MTGDLSHWGKIWQLIYWVSFWPLISQTCSKRTGNQEMPTDKDPKTSHEKPGFLAKEKDKGQNRSIENLNNDHSALVKHNRKHLVLPQAHRQMSSGQFTFTWGTPTLHQSGLRED